MHKPTLYRFQVVMMLISNIHEIYTMLGTDKGNLYKAMLNYVILVNVICRLIMYVMCRIVIRDIMRRLMMYDVMCRFVTS